MLTWLKELYAICVNQVKSDFEGLCWKRDKEKLIIKQTGDAEQVIRAIQYMAKYQYLLDNKELTYSRFRKWYISTSLVRVEDTFLYLQRFNKAILGGHELPKPTYRIEDYESIKVLELFEGHSVEANIAFIKASITSLNSILLNYQSHRSHEVVMRRVSRLTSMLADLMYIIGEIVYEQKG